jgi:RimJ/RimL family protein N-acetyltransferase
VDFRLETDRLILRPIKTSDVEAFLSYRNDPDVAHFQGWELPYSREDVQTMLARIVDQEIPIEPGDRFKVAVALKATDEMIGEIGFQLHRDDAKQAHVGGSIARPHWKKGYAYEASQVLVAFLFKEHGLHRITAEINVDNVPSWKLVEKLGFRREAHFVENTIFNDTYVSEYHYAILKREWKQIKGNG